MKFITSMFLTYHILILVQQLLIFVQFWLLALKMKHYQCSQSTNENNILKGHYFQDLGKGHLKKINKKLIRL